MRVASRDIREVRLRQIDFAERCRIFFVDDIYEDSIVSRMSKVL